MRVIVLQAADDRNIGPGLEPAAPGFVGRLKASRFVSQGRCSSIRSLPHSVRKPNAQGADLASKPPTQPQEIPAHLTVTPDEDGSRLDRMLIRRLGASRRSLILRLIRKGNVRVNRKRARPDARVSCGDVVFLPASLRSIEERPAGVPAWLVERARALEVLYEDESLLAVNKPAGLVVHGGSGYEAGLIEAIREARNLPELRLAHRLDRDTSGVLLMAKSLGALRSVAASFRDRSLRKTYLALIAGHPKAHAGRMVARLVKGVVRGGERVVVGDERGKEARTDFQVVMHLRRQGLAYALIALRPHSGRTHQLRVQLAEQGHPILGDGKYGLRTANKAFRELGGRGLALHAWRLRLRHPVHHRMLELVAPVPEGWRAWLSAEYLSAD